MIEGAVRPAARVAARASGRSGCRRAGGSNGRTARSRRRSRPRTRSSCAARNSTPPGATNSPSGATPTRPSTCCNSACGWAQRPRQLITTTPRPIALIKRLMADPRTAVTRAATQANAAHLSPAFLDEVLARYAGTRLGRQEIDGEIIEDRADALWSRAMIEAARVAAAPPLGPHRGRRRSAGLGAAGADACGIVAAGQRRGRRVYVLEDASVAGCAPAGWAGKAVALYRRLAGRHAGRRGQPGRRHGARGAGAGRRLGAAARPCTRRAANGCAPSRSPRCTRRARSSTSPPMPALEDEMCDFGIGGLVVRRLARPARRAGLGGDGANKPGRVAGTEDQEVVRKSALKISAIRHKRRFIISWGREIISAPMPAVIKYLAITKLRGLTI